jgi:hypothetical protein
LATIGHVAVACVGARTLWRPGEPWAGTLAAMSILSLAPDLDFLRTYWGGIPFVEEPRV